MSMLTPPGMSGKKYRITGDRYPRMRRPRRRGRKVLALIATLALIGLLGYGTLQLVDVFGGDDERQNQAGPPADQDCRPADDAKPVPLPEPEAITVNVYNATTRSGLAQLTADTLAERGFTIGEISNAPEELDGQLAGTGLLLGSELAETSGALAVLGTYLAEVETQAVEREDASVDLVLGDGFEALAEEDDVAAALQALAAGPEDDCAADGDGAAGGDGEADGDEADPAAEDPAEDE
jgi:hypothetical protein